MSNKSVTQTSYHKTGVLYQIAFSLHMQSIMVC